MIYLWVTFLSISLFANADDIVGKNFRNKNYEKKSLKQVTFIDCDLTYANFKGSDLQDVTFVNTIMIDASFENAKLLNVTFIKSNLGGSDFKDAKIDIMKIKQSRAPKLRFWKSQINHLRIESSYLSSTDLSESKFNKVEISDSKIDDSIFWPASPTKLSLKGTDSSKASFNKNVTLNQTKPSKAFKTEFTDVEILNHPILTKECLKRFPLYHRNRFFNGPTVLTDGESRGLSFNSCSKTMEFEVKIKYDNWPLKMRKDLLLEVVTNRTSNPSMFLPLDGTKQTINFKIQDKEPFGVYEIKVISNRKIKAQ